MEILKKLNRSLFIFILCLLSLQLACSQDFISTRDAFQNSYIQEATGDFAAAANSLKSVYDEKSYELNLRLGWLTYLSGNFTEAMAYYNNAVSLKPFAIESKFGIIYPASAMGNWTFVINQYQKILEIAPNNTYALHRLGLVYYGREDYENALKYFEKVVNLYPFDYNALTMLGWTYFKLANYREAKVLFQKALLNTPNGTSATEGLELLK